MAERVLAMWANLPCAACQSESFVPLVAIQAKPGQGTTTKQIGWKCSACGQVADIHAMQTALVRSQRLKELRALEDEMAQAEPAGSARPNKSARTSGS